MPFRAFPVLKNNVDDTLHVAVGHIIKMYFYHENKPPKIIIKILKLFVIKHNAFRHTCLKTCHTLNYISLLLVCLQKTKVKVRIISPT
jgi:hypothetical protein